MSLLTLLEDGGEMAASDAKAIPVKNQAYRITFPILDADGDLVTGAASLDPEVSLDGGAFTNCTNAATEIGTSGMYYLDLTSAEMNADTVAVIVKTATAGAKTTPIVLYPAARSINDLAYPTTTGRSIDVTASGAVGIDWGNVENAGTTVGLSGTTVKDATDVNTAVGVVDGVVDALYASTVHRINTAQAGAAGSITLDASASAVDDFYNGLFIVIFSGTGAGQVRPITDYVGATKVATIAPNWSTTPDNTSSFSLVTNAVVPWNAAWDAEVQSEVADALEEAVADSIPADGSRPSIKQALYMLTQFMLERSVSATTVTVNKPDGSTALFTLTLDSAATPTSITRAS
jgi:hypothetical protein